MATVPNPTLDARDGAQVAAESIEALPNELSDRNDSNPAVAIIEASAAQYDKAIFQINNWPSAVIQKALALVGVTVLDAAAATVQQTFTLSQPQPTDTVINSGTTVATSDGATTFETTEDLTISAYTTPAGTITITSGSTGVTGSGTAFVTDGTWTGYQIQGVGGAWYTISSVASGTSLTLTTPATSTQSGVAFNVGPITGTVAAQCTDTGVDGNVAANLLTTLQSAPSGVASTNNASAATGGTDDETDANAIARAPQAFSARDVACTVGDYAYFAKQVLGGNGRAKAQANTNGTSTLSGYVTVALLSPNWTASAPVSASERAAVIQDLAGRQAIGSTTVDAAATIDSYGATSIVACYYRKSAYDSTTVSTAFSTAVANYLNPYTYEWGRSIYTADLIELVESTKEIDRLYTVNGVAAVGTNYASMAANATFTNGSTSVTGVGAADYAAVANYLGQTFIVDTATNTAYLITARSGGNVFTIHTAFAGTTATVTKSWFISQDDALSNWHALPYATAATSVIIGSV